MHEIKKPRKTTFAYPIRYEGNVFFLILFLLLWLPLGVMLFIKNGRFIKNQTIFLLSYHGNYFWLFFWAIIFFPLAVVLLIINGIDLIEESLP